MFYKLYANKVNKQLKEMEDTSSVYTLENIAENMITQLVEQGLTREEVMGEDVYVTKYGEKSLTVKKKGSKKKYKVIYLEGLTKDYLLQKYLLANDIIINKEKAPIMQLRIKCLNLKNNKKEKFTVEHNLTQEDFKYVLDMFKKGNTFTYGKADYKVLKKISVKIEEMAFNSVEDYIDYGLYLRKDITLYDMMEEQQTILLDSQVEDMFKKHLLTVLEESN